MSITDLNYFTHEQLKCPCCNQNKMQQSTLLKLHLAQSLHDKPIQISSAYRCSAYNAKKGYTQTHSTGKALDIQCFGAEYVALLKVLLTVGFTGIGSKQTGDIDSRFIHVDDLTDDEVKQLNANASRPWGWTYK